MSEWHRAEIERRDERIVELCAEIERLRAHIQQHIAQLAHTETQLADTAAFLDRLAERVQTWPVTVVDPKQLEARCGPVAAECRAQARKLRGETT